MRLGGHMAWVCGRILEDDGMFSCVLSDMLLFAVLKLGFGAICGMARLLLRSEA